jgi:hypothetical protein
MSTPEKPRFAMQSLLSLDFRRVLIGYSLVSGAAIEPLDASPTPTI